MCLLLDINEANWKDLRSKTDKKTRQRANVQLSSEFQEVNKSGTVVFLTESGTQPGQGIYWKQTIKLLDLPLALRIPGTMTEKMRAAINGDIKVTCNCPAFKYWGWAYITTEMNAKFGYQERRFPSERNPSLKGSVCKHLDNALLALPFNAAQIGKQLNEIRN